MSDSLKLHILSPERRLIEGIDVAEVTLPTHEGQVQVLPGHTAMVGQIDTGPFSYKPLNEPETVGVFSSGFFEVKGDVLYVMAETLELRGEVDLDRARKAQKLAEETLMSADLDEHKFKKYQLKLQRALVRQQVAGK